MGSSEAQDPSSSCRTPVPRWLSPVLSGEVVQSSSASHHAASTAQPVGTGPHQKGNVCNGKANVSRVLLPINCCFTFAEKFTEI